MIFFGREITGDLKAVLRREWLVTNGLGGWAMGTVAGANTRRYHGLLVPALMPPLGRTVLLAKLDETVTLGKRSFDLTTNEFADGTVSPHGYRLLDSFCLDGSIPVWTYSLDDALLVKRLWMVHGLDRTYVTYTLARGAQPVALDLLALVTYRDAHVETRGDWNPEITRAGPSFAIQAFPGARAFRVVASCGSFKKLGEWYRGFHWRAEEERGLPDREDLYAAGRFTATLEPGQTLALLAALDGPAGKTATEEEAGQWEKSLKSEKKRVARIQARAGVNSEPEWVRRLPLAADQFHVKRGRGRTVIAGYPWFGDWGRDTMIALPGLCLATGRSEEAGVILRTFAEFVDRGMVPNRFPDAGEQPEYNTADATLWYFHAIDRYVDTTGDSRLARDLYPLLEEIVRFHVRGTRHLIGMDHMDALLYAGEEGVQLTWMDAKVGNWVVTPRIGKPVEINALWVNALRVMARLSEILTIKVPSRDYAALADQAASSFDKFWNKKLDCLFDVIDLPPHGKSDPTLRPNQLFAVSLPYAPIPAGDPRAKSIVDLCARQFYTPLGLRSLALGASGYIGHYGGDQRARDGAYHQGTVWAWLIGPFVEAHLKVYKDPALARSFLDSFEHHLADHGLGSISEIFDGDPPFTPRGCIAQAWSVAEVLRSWKLVGQDAGMPATEGKPQRSARKPAAEKKAAPKKPRGRRKSRA